MRNSKLKLMRQARGLLLRQVAEKLNCSNAAVLNAEKRGLKTESAAKRYADALDCAPAEIIEATEYKGGMNDGTIH